jgi:RES domain-containing protein
MFVYRISGKKYSTDLTGLGAALYGGRWNKKGTPVLYTGESKEIALLESIVHLPPMILPKVDIITLEIPDDSITIIKIKNLPKNWSSYPAPSILSEIGEKWIREEKTIALKVPSSIISSAHNLILNCKHPNFDRVKIVDKSHLKIDSRLLKKK